MYKRLFYSYYKWSSKVNGDDEYPQYVALIILIFVTYCNILTLGLALRMIFDVSLNGSNITVPQMIVMLLLFSLPHYMFLIRANRYHSIVEDFDQKGQESQGKHNIFAWAYTFCSIILLFAVFLVQAAMNAGAQ